MYAMLVPGGKRLAPIPVMVEAVNLEDSAFGGKCSNSSRIRKSDMLSALLTIYFVYQRLYVGCMQLLGF
jgi:hypothetical protein